MATLTDITTPALAEKLVGEGYTVETLATATVRRLVKIRGIGEKTAETLIDAARLATNTAGMAESSYLDHLPGPMAPAPEVPKYSVRLKRIMAAREGK